MELKSFYPESHKVTPSCQLLTDYSQGDGQEAGGSHFQELSQVLKSMVKPEHRPALLTV